jgi:hypothetical protein
MNSWKSIFAVGVCVLFVVGCGTKKPDGIPELHPAKVIVQNAGAPIADATVLFAGGTSGSWSIIGITDSSGVAVITTSQGSWKDKGAPAGEYKVYITKKAEVQQDPLPPELQNDSDAIEKHSAEYMKLLQNAPKVIPDGLTNPAKTPLTLTVGAGGPAELTVDVSKHQ